MRAIKANMIPGGVTPTINVSQYDNDYAVTVTLIEGAEIYTPPSGATIRVEGTKPDGHGFEYPCTYQGNVVTMPIYTQMTVVSGRFPIELVVYQSGLRVGSCNIIFAVEKAPLGEDTDISETVIPDIIAGAQAQADAAATSATSAESAKVAAMDAAEDAIEAAQELETAVQFNSALIKETVSGDIAIFADGSDNIPVQSLVAEITPVQSGSGDPSPTNIRPISGRTGLTVTRVGKNLIDDSIKTSQSAATVVIGQTSTTGFDIFLPAGTYTVSFASEKNPSINYRLSTESSGAHAVVSYGNRSGTFTLTESAYLRMWAYLSGGIVPSDITWFQLEAGSTATAYEPYTAQTYPITWQTEAGTVYGGTLNVTTGVLTVDKAVVDMGSLNYTYDSSGGRFYTSVSGKKNEASDSDMMLAISSMYKPMTATAFQSNPTNGTMRGATVGGYCYFRNNEYTDAASFKTAMAGQTLVYKLATPQTYNITPISGIKTLLGGNTIYTDAGAVSVEYVADTKLYIDNKIAELQALVLENN